MRSGTGRIVSRNGTSRFIRTGFWAGIAKVLTLLPALGLALVLSLAPMRAEAADLDKGLMRLAEIFGSVHHLRDVCGANDGPLWRNKMIDMMNAAELSSKDRQRMITHFNDAYYDARTRYPYCSNHAAKRANGLFDEAHRLAARLSRGAQTSMSLF